jgi:excisionase family DNA binding protein
MTPLLDAEEAAAMLNVPKSWVMDQARANKIPHVKLGHYTRFHRDALEEWAREASRGPRRDKRAKGA